MEEMVFPLTVEVWSGDLPHSDDPGLVFFDWLAGPGKRIAQRA